MSEQKGGLAQGANGQLVALENVIYHLEDIETDVHGNLPWTQVANAIEHIKLCAEPRTPAGTISPQYAAELGRQVDELEADNAQLRAQVEGLINDYD